MLNSDNDEHGINTTIIFLSKMTFIDTHIWMYLSQRQSNWTAHSSQDWLDW